MAFTASIYETLDEVGRLTMSLEKMNMDNMSPIHGVADAVNDMGFRECVEHAAVRVPCMVLQKNPPPPRPFIKKKIF